MDKEKVNLVPVTMKDMDLLFEWVNDDECRRYAFNSNKIAFHEHKKWFLDRINDENCIMFFYACNNVYIGQVRVEIKDAIGYIDYSIKKEYRGRGHGTQILELLENKFLALNNLPIKYLAGEVKVDNSASQRIFEKLGYIAERKNGYVSYKKILVNEE